MLLGRRKWVRVGELKVGMRVLDPILGVRGKVLVLSGEVLSQKHVDQLKKWEARPGAGRLSLYTRGVWTKMALGSGDERPKCDSDPYAALSVQKIYRTKK